MNTFFAVVKRHALPLACVNGLILAIVLGFRYWTYSEVWTANTKLTLPEASANLNVDLGPLGSLENVSPDFSSQINPLKLQIAILRSDAVMSEVLEMDAEGQDFDKLSTYRKLFTMETQEQAPILQISSQGNTPDLAQVRLNNLLQVYQKRLEELRRTNSETIDAFNQSKLAEVRERLNSAERELSTFQKESGLINPNTQVEALVESLSTLQNNFVVTDAEARALRDQTNILVDRLGFAPDVAIQALGLNQDEAYLRLREELINTSILLSETLVTYTPAHPEAARLIALQTDLESQLRQYIAEVNADLTTASTLYSTGVEGRADLIREMILTESLAASKEREAAQIDSELLRLEQQLQSIPDASIKLLELQRNYEVADSLYKGLIAQTQQSNIDAFSSYPNIQILDPPRIDPVPIVPSLRLTLANAILAMLFTSLAAILIFEGRDPLLVASDFKDTRLPDIFHLSKSNNPEAKLLDENQTYEFQWLATSLSSVCPTGTAILVTSAVNGEGRTRVTLGLANEIASLGYRTLIVDASCSPTSRLTRNLKLLAKLHSEHHVEIAPLLDVMTTGGSRDYLSNESILRGEFKTAIMDLVQSKSYDYVFVYAPPIICSGKALLLAKAMQQVLFIVRPRYSKRNPTLQALDQLSQQSVKLLGLVVNGGDQSFMKLKQASISSRSKKNIS